MLVPFVIDADSLVPDPAWIPAQQRSYYNSLLDIWQRAGLLAHDGDSLHGSRLHQAVQALPQSVRPRWLELLKRGPLLAIPEWNGSVSVATLGHFANVAQLALVDDARAEVEFGFSDDCDEASQSANGTDVDASVCRLLAAGQARAFQAAIALSGSHIEAGDTFQFIWDVRFKTLAKAPIKLVSVVDRYAMSQHMACPQTRISGLESFLRLLDKDATGHRYVTIYSACATDMPVEHRNTIQDIETELRLIFNKLPRKNIKRIKAFMVPNKFFRDDSHDRFIRFGDYIWDIGLGLEVFDVYSAKRSSAGFKSGMSQDSYKRVEQDLEKNAITNSIEIK
jgi:hypothetical protein